MKKVLRLSLATAGLFTVGLWIGYSFGFRSGLVASTTAAAAEKPADWQEWKYPGITVEVSTSRGMEGHILGQVIRPQVCFIGTTPDEFDKVVAHYAEKCPESRLPAEFGTEGVRGTVVQSNQLDDSCTSTRRGNPPRPVKLKGFAVQTASYSLVVIISRAEGEKETHILLVHQ